MHTCLAARGCSSDCMQWRVAAACGEADRCRCRQRKGNVDVPPQEENAGIKKERSARGADLNQTSQ